VREPADVLQFPKAVLYSNSKHEQGKIVDQEVRMHRVMLLLSSLLSSSAIAVSEILASP
jgi:hypothetical protein